MISKIILSFMIVSTFGILSGGVIDVHATFLDDVFKYRECIFKGTFGNLFCPSNPDDYQPAQLCLADDKNCVINSATSP